MARFPLYVNLGKDKSHPGASQTQEPRENNASRALSDDLDLDDFLIENSILGLLTEKKAESEQRDVKM